MRKSRIWSASSLCKIHSLGGVGMRSYEERPEINGGKGSRICAKPKMGVLQTLSLLQALSHSKRWHSSTIQRSHCHQWESAEQRAEKHAEESVRLDFDVLHLLVWSQDICMFSLPQVDPDHYHTSFVWLEELFWEMDKELVKKFFTGTGVQRMLLEQASP